MFEDVRTKAETKVECDNIIICRGYTGRPKLYDELYDKVPELYMAGDATMKLRCVDKRVIGNAVEDAFGVANRI